MPLAPYSGMNDMASPKLAICNFLPDARTLREAALDRNFSGVDWTLRVEDLPKDDLEEARLRSAIASLSPLEVRCHCAFTGVDFGDADDVKAEEAAHIFERAARLTARLGMRFMTVHLGLGRASCDGLSWERSVTALGRLSSLARSLGVRLCLENLAAGWSSRPELFERLVRKSGADVTLDIGHARVSPSVESGRFAFEDFVTPHSERIRNAHIYHEERDGGHTPPENVEDLRDRLELLTTLSCDWWVLELREEEALGATLKVVREFLAARSEAAPERQFEAL